MLRRCVSVGDRVACAVDCCCCLDETYQGHLFLLTAIASQLVDMIAPIRVFQLFDETTHQLFVEIVKFEIGNRRNTSRSAPAEGAQGAMRDLKQLRPWPGQFCHKQVACQQSAVYPEEADDGVTRRTTSRCSSAYGD